VIWGGSRTRLNRSCQGSCQGHARGRCSVTRRADEAIRAGTVTSLRRMVAVVALASAGPVIVAAARVRLNAITASTSQAAFAAKAPQVIWSRSDGGHDVHDEGVLLSEVRRGCGYLRLSITERRKVLDASTACAHARFSERVLDGARR
jgi:hypothetical protein